jgi:hypothetical protein
MDRAGFGEAGFGDFDLRLRASLGESDLGCSSRFACFSASLGSTLNSTASWRLFMKFPNKDSSAPLVCFITPR